MKKTVLKLSVCFLVFLLALFIVSSLMNSGRDNLTMEMAPASFPLVTMVMGETEYNQLHGYSAGMETAFQRDTMTVLGESRDTDFVVDTYGQAVTGISIEVRSGDGTRLIENTNISDYYTEDNRIRGRIALKDLIERDTEYSLTILLEIGGSRTISYYTRVMWSDSLYADEKLAFCVDFHQRLYDRELARELTKYLESNPKLEDNASFHKVNIHSSFRQITWGDLEVEEAKAPVIRLTEIAPQTASLLMDYIVSTSEGKNTTYYTVEEYYRIRYTSDRIYLLEYERTMNQIADTEHLFANDKILLGITGTDVPMVESEDGNILVFELSNRLLSYNITTNKLTVIFSFYDEDNADARTMYDQHDIKILNVDEGGNVQFAVYGYMNRGRHEGEVGIQLYTHNSEQNTIEELLYIPYDKTYTILKAEMEELLYLNREQNLYLMLDSEVYGIDLVGRTYSRLVEIVHDESVQVSENHKIIIWPEGEDMYHSTALNIRNLGNDTQRMISAGPGEVIRPLGFMDEDIIYGVARADDVREENTGRVFFPMYKICICSSEGETLKEYNRSGIYLTACTVEDNQIMLERARQTESGAFQEIEPDQVTNNMEAETGKNVIVTANTERYERYVEIQMRKTVDSKAVKILNPKEVVYEGGRRLELPETADNMRYYVYGPYGVEGIYYSSASAVNLAYAASGIVVNGNGECIWLKGNRAPKNQIMAVRADEATEERGALAVCLDTMLTYEGISRNSQYYLERGDTILDILGNNLENASVLDLSGCSLDAVLYYVNRDIPVLALMKDGSAVLLVGFNESNTGIMNPLTGTIYTMRNSEATEWFEENGNQFITYLKE